MGTIPQFRLESDSTTPVVVPETKKFIIENPPDEAIEEVVKRGNASKPLSDEALKATVNGLRGEVVLHVTMSLADHEKLVQAKDGKVEEAIEHLRTLYGQGVFSGNHQLDLTASEKDEE